jgi:hypothetical protein
MMKLVFLLPLLWLIPQQETQLSADEIMTKSEDRMKGNSAYAEATITTIRPKYTREMTIKTWTKGDDYAVTLVTSPAKDKGMVSLKRKNELWSYNPAIDRTVKMPPSMLSQSWMGTDIKNDDLLESSNKKDDFNKEITGEFEIEGLPCYRIRLTPKEDVNSIWGKIVIWISKKDFLQMQVMYFDEDMELVNTFFASQVKELDGLLMPTVNTIVPAKKKGHKTKMEITKRVVNLEIDDQVFTTQYIKRLK